MFKACNLHVVLLAQPLVAAHLLLNLQQQQQGAEHREVSMTVSVDQQTVSPALRYMRGFSYRVSHKSCTPGA
jgi:hypothetical protein